MLENDFIASSLNITDLDSAAAETPIAFNRIDNAGLNTIMSNSFGFGGTNATLLFQKTNQ
jgi:3-oxoacyl-[acyl-carrier-protein] synthase-1